jgi:hypothetical protein
MKQVIPPTDPAATIALALASTTGVNFPYFWSGDSLSDSCL